MQHTKEVRDMVEEHDMRIHPSACTPHDVEHGYPPYLHPFMPLDHRAFAPYQQEMSKLCKDECQAYADENDNGSKSCFIFDHCVEEWGKLKYMNICALKQYQIMALYVGKHLIMMIYVLKQCQIMVLSDGVIKGLKFL